SHRRRAMREEISRRDMMKAKGIGAAAIAAAEQGLARPARAEDAFTIASTGASWGGSRVLPKLDGRGRRRLRACHRSGSRSIDWAARPHEEKAGPTERHPRPARRSHQGSCSAAHARTRKAAK